MSTVNGFGTRFYGWRHSPDGTSTATRWIALFYIPVVPLSRSKMRVLTDFKSEKFFPKASAAAKKSALPLFNAGMVTREDRYEMIASLPLSGEEIATTYFSTFVLLPIAMLWPTALVYGFGSMTKQHNWQDEMWVLWFFLLLGLGALANVVGVAIWAIRQTRGVGCQVP